MEISKFMKTVLEMAGVEEPLEEMAYPINFNLEEFSRIPTFSGRKKYCDERLQKIGTGSSRIVYRVDDEKALKIAKNKKGIAQNEHEADWGRNNYDIFAKIYEADENNYTWIEMELASKIKPSDFKRLVDVSWAEVCLTIEYIYDIYKPNKNPYYVKRYNSDLMEKFMNEEVYSEKNEFLFNLYGYMTDYQPMMINDWTRIANWGIVERNGQELPVIIDDGLDELIYKTYYGW